jgi:predicted DNA-binding protein YlxM (UPF0122 family)
MTQDLFEVLSPRQRDVFKLKKIHGKSFIEIAAILQITPQAVREQWIRIENKITELGESDIDIAEDVKNIFDDESSRTLNKRTVNQAQVLAQSTQMSTRKSGAVRKQRYRMGLRCTIKEVVHISKCEPTLFSHQQNDPILKALKDPCIPRMELEYYSVFGETIDLERMCLLELNLRTAGVIYRTPYINQANRKTGTMMRCQGSNSDYKIVDFPPGANKSIPPLSRHLDTSKNSEGGVDYRTYLVPKYV